MQQGWTKTELEVLEPLWSCGDVLPTSLVDLRDAGDREADDQVYHEEHNDNYEFDSFDESDEWYVNGLTGPLLDPCWTLDCCQF